MASFIKVRFKKINYNSWNISTWKAFEWRYYISAESKWRLLQVSKYNINMLNFFSFKKLFIFDLTKGDFFVFPEQKYFFEIINLLLRSIISDTFEIYFLAQNQKGKCFFILYFYYNVSLSFLYVWSLGN